STHKPPQPEDLSEPYSYTGPDPYDVNFLFPLHLATLESDRVKLTPFIPNLHAATYLAETLAHPSLNEYFSATPPSSLGDLLHHIEQLRQDPRSIAFAIIDKCTPNPNPVDKKGTPPGFVALVDASAANLTVDLGRLCVFPAFQRTHVTSNSVGLLLRYCLELPTHTSTPGLGMRRVGWGATSWHDASIRAAQRLGFTREGITRWHVAVYNEGKKLMPVRIREGDPLGAVHGGRSDSLMFSFCTDDWEEGGRERVGELINQRVQYRSGAFVVKIRIRL
ncbi:acyl-CoA N-acyltransferase, partial [Amylostereum chailletii]